MQNTLLDIDKKLSHHVLVNSSLSFKKFIEHIKCKAEAEQTVRTKFYRYVLKKFKLHQELGATISLKEIEKYTELFELIYSCLLPFTSDENNSLWGLSVPIVPKIFYGTNALYKVLRDQGTGKAKLSAISDLELEEAGKHKIEWIYSLLLERLYNIQPVFPYEMVHSLVDEKTNLRKYYRVNIDTRFIDIHINGKLPDLSFEKLQLLADDKKTIDFLKEQLSFSLFRFEGFSVVTAIDVTEHYAVEIIKDSIVNRAAHNDDFYFHRVVEALKTLCGSNSIEFGLMPMLRINNKLVFNADTCPYSVLVQKITMQGIAEAIYLEAAEKYSESPKLLLFKTITEEDRQRQNFLNILKQNGIQAYAMIPVFYNNSLAGVLEVFSKEENLLDEKIIVKLDIVLPLLSQLMQNSIDEFDARIDSIIKEKFTSLQPAVYWKFNESAWRYFKDNYFRNEKAEIETVYFENVYPLYGTFDIRNSTAERNNALRADLKIQFDLLLQTLTALKKQFNLVLIEEKMFECKEWMGSISENLTANDEISINGFLAQEINPFLAHFKENYASAVNLIDIYFRSMDEQTGTACANRRALETSMGIINTTINNRLDQFKDELQKSYPCYVEKIRTDGVEYDIYIGQTIAPEKAFDVLYLSNLRLWQLTSMAEIVKLTNALLPQLSKPLRTTQLIFVHGNTIDISFRNDERRFDVEGSYNIRYQVIKKRIDKVLISNTNERLTQPGKIALVYFNKTDADEYVKYIYYLQEQNILNDDLEQLELEELQGVSGLKALRVGVHLD